MGQYINKDDIVAEINKLRSKVSDSSSYCNGWQHALRMLEIELNTIEVKEEITTTDAVIEKAINFLEMLGYGFTITDNITHANYDKKQLIEDFQNYIRKE